MPMPDLSVSARRVFDELLSKGELDVADELFTPDCHGQDPTHPSVLGASGFKQYTAEVRTAFPDLRFALNEIVVSGNTVVTLFTATGTNRGPLPGIGLPPTGRSSTNHGLVLAHYDASGKIKDWFSTWDTLGQMVQLGLVPQMEQAVPESAPRPQPTM